MLITLVVANVNAKICASGQILGSIFARKGVLALQRRKLSVNWVGNIESIWGRETLKLSTYYEMIWRNEKELAFTAGQMNKPMNFKFIFDVS